MKAGGLQAEATPGFLAGPVIIGSLIHLMLSALFGVGFGALTTRIWNVPHLSPLLVINLT